AAGRIARFTRPVAGSSLLLSGGIPPACSSGRCRPFRRTVSADCAAPAFTGHPALCCSDFPLRNIPQRPSCPFTPMDLVKGPHASGACGILHDRKDGAEGGI